MIKFIHTSYIFLIYICLFSISLGVIAICPAFGQTSGIGIYGKVLNVYPNPAISYINFEFSSDVERPYILMEKQYTLTIYNFVGKKMTEVYIDRIKYTINLSNYYRGIYIYQVKDRIGRVVDTGKFIVGS